MLFTDKITLDGTRRTRDGYLTADVRVARTGIQTYAGSEVGKPEMEQVRVYRPEAEVFKADAMRSFAHRPVTNDHPPEAVQAKNWKQHSVGMTGDEVARDGIFVRVPMVVMDQATIDEIETGKRELSMGYSCTLDFMPGTTPEGEAYDASQKQIRGNHLAIVAAGRAGSSCRIGDSWAAITPPEKEPMTTKIVVDGVTLTSLEDAAAAITSVQAKVRDAEAKAADAIKVIEAKDGAHAALIATKDAEIAALKVKVADEANLDARIEQRQAVIDTAAKITGKTIESKGKTLDAIRREVVTARLGDDSVKGRDEAYFIAAFDVLAASTSESDPLRNALKDGVKAAPVLLDAYKKRDEDLSNAWKSSIKKEG